MSPEEAEEARQLEVSALFVAMTRARDVLVLLHNGEPSNAIAPAIDHFKRLSQAR